MKKRLHDFVARPAILRRAISLYQAWIEEQLGVPVSECVIVESPHNVCQLGVEKILALNHHGAPKAVRRLRSFVAGADIPPGIAPMMAYGKASPDQSLSASLGGNSQPRSSRLEWQDCPIALRLHTVASLVIALNVHYQPGPSAQSDLMSSLLITKRCGMEQLIRLLETVDARESTPKLHTYRGPTRRVAPCSWDDLVLDPATCLLLKRDFENFWDREEWFRQHHLPFRRGYVFHGPPGNGKSSAVRAMMCSRQLGAFTFRLFDRNISDYDLDELFDEALTERPAMILLEDLDRAFPRAGESRTQISLQHLLNCLDGVATGEGIVVIATANEPTALDPAILRRPGRFDRVIHFANPTAALRGQYFRWLHPAFSEDELQQPVEESKGFSFAQLRESFVLAAQFSSAPDIPMTGEHLLHGIRTLRHTFVQGARRSNSAGFAESLPSDPGARIEMSEESCR